MDSEFDVITVRRCNLSRLVHRRPIFKLLEFLCALAVWIAHIMCPMLRTVYDHTVVPMTAGGFTLISGVLFAGYVLNRKCPVVLEGIWNAIGFGLFLWNTATVMDSLSHTDEGTTRVLIVSKGCAAACTSLVHLLDLVLDLSVLSETARKPTMSQSPSPRSFA